jgi:ERCC4-type nuclease
LQIVLERSNVNQKCKTTQNTSNYKSPARWGEQSKRLSEASCKIFFIIEGDLREDLGIQYNSLISSLLNAELRKNTHVIRTMDIKETVTIIKHLSQKCDGSLPTGIPTTITKKRKRDADPDLVFMRQLMCIPTMSENVAKKILEKFSSINELQKALNNKAEFPKIMLDTKNSLGKKRIETLCRYLL